MTIINDTTVVVYTYEELKKSLEEQNNYTTVHFGANITLTNGIKISSTKSNITIDGTYNNTTYTLEDKKSTSASDTINISSNLIKNVIVQNINIIGYNYYGVICVPESNIYKDTVVEYNNITYKGPQISFHPNGLTRLINSNITIEDNYATGNEVAETNQIEIGKTTTITHKSTANSSFWFRNSNPSLTILPNAKVEFISENRELFYGPTNLTLTIKQNAIFNITTKNGMAYATFGTGTTTLEQNTTLKIKQTARNSNYPTWYSYGPITINEQATLEIINNYPNISTSNYNISFQNKDSFLTINNPKKIMLYNTTANIINTTTSIPFQFTFNRTNLFTNAISIEQSITKNTLPTYSWYKKELSTIKGTFNNTTTTISETNYTEEELQTLPALSNFIFQTKKAFTIGDFKVNMNPITDTDTTIEGTTEPLASLLIEYENNEITTIADETGKFSHNLEEPLPIGTIITINAKQNNELIYHTKQVQIIYPGELNIESATKKIPFKLTPIKTNPIICPRKDELKVVVKDSRITKTNWKLYAQINNDLTSSSDKTLKDSLIFIDQNNNITTMTQEKILIYQNTQDEETTTITWDDDKGILLKLTEPLINNMEYESIITWTLEE